MSAQRTAQPAQMNDDGTLCIAGCELPISELFDAPSRSAYLRWQQSAKDLGGARPPGHWSDPEVIPAWRAFADEYCFVPVLERMHEVYSVTLVSERINGVQTDVITPAAGIPPKNRGRVLLNLHGGGFCMGERLAGRIESIPVAAVGGFKVISVDYRMGPEHEFPSPVDDVFAVYRHLLEHYPASNIGIFGHSAGAIITAQLIARLQMQSLPLPAAVAMLGAGAGGWWKGDSVHLGTVLAGEPVLEPGRTPGFKNADPDDSLVSPLCSDQVMSRFPPSLLVTSTRDWQLSAVVHTHSRLVALGAHADLHVWEGLPHGFHYVPDLPQSGEVHDVTVRFFDRHLAKSNRQ